MTITLSSIHWKKKYVYGTFDNTDNKMRYSDAEKVHKVTNYDVKSFCNFSIVPASFKG